jgi:uncharacterized membrane protein
MTLQCTECSSTNIDYLPDVDGNSWVNITYKQDDKGVWKAILKGERSVSLNQEMTGNVDVSLINTKDIFYNDGNAFFYCNDCKIEFDSRSL